MHLVHNEQIKLGAMAMNTSAVGLVVAGLFTPLSNSLNDVPGFSSSDLFYMRMMFWVGFAIIIHIVARLSLESLRDE